MSRPFVPLAVGLLLSIVPTTLPTSASAQSMATRPADLLRPGDVITLKVWREPDWSGDFTVNESGVATFPRIGPVQVTAMSADSLRTFLVDSLRHFLKNPSIEVIPQRRIRVLGAVRNPGLYPVPATVTVGDAVAVAGGATQDGKPDQVKLRRNGQELMVDMARDTRLADTPVQTGDELFVPERSWVSRNAVLVGAGFSAVTTVLVAVLIQ